MKSVQKIIPQVLFIILAVIFQTSCKNSNKEKKNPAGEESLKGNISISGAFALYPLTVGWAEEFRKTHPRVNIDISAGGAGKGMADVLSGMVDLAMFSREVTEEEMAKGAWKLAVAKDAVFPTVNAENPAIAEIMQKGLTREHFLKLFTAEKQPAWNAIDGIISTEKINIYTRSDACGAAAMWAEYFGKTQEELKGIGVYGDPGIADAVKKDKYGIGFNNLIYIYDLKSKNVMPGLAIIPIDLNGNRVVDEDEKIYGTMETAVAAIQSGKYPSPPARNLYLIAKGNPENEAILSFLKYILTEGQKLTAPAGYVELDTNTLGEQKLALLSKSE